MLRSGLLAVYQPKDKRNHVLIVQHYLQDNLGYTPDNATGFTSRCLREQGIVLNYKTFDECLISASPTYQVSN